MIFMPYWRGRCPRCRTAFRVFFIAFYPLWWACTLAGLVLGVLYVDSWLSIAAATTLGAVVGELACLRLKAVCFRICSDCMEKHIEDAKQYSER